jgi:superfamily II DNA or RNA helicase
MMINTAIKINSSALKNKAEPQRVNVTFNDAGDLKALCWLFDDGLRAMAKRRGGLWNRDAGGWTFSDSARAQELLDEILKKYPDWPIIGHPDKPYLPLKGVQISRLSLRDGLQACLVPFPLPVLSDVPEVLHVFQLAGARGKKEEVGLLIDSTTRIDAAVDLLVKQGAICNDNLSKKWSLAADAEKLQVKANGWAVQVDCDLSNPLHFLAAPSQKYRWEGAWPNGVRIAIPWTGAIHTTRKHWPDLKAELLEAGLEWEGDDPDAELTAPAMFDAARVPGWNSPAPNGHLLHAYQQKGVEFCIQRGMRALIGDEMGVGKTAQAIAAAEASGALRILVICPANARYVWEREIKGWGGRGGVQHITSQLDKLDLSALWHIVTYDLIAARTETWRLKDAQEEQAFVEAFPNLKKSIQKPVTQKDSYPRKVALEEALDKVPAFADRARVAAWKKMMQRLRGELLEQILAAGPLLTILDEAHRAKNKTAKRTQAIQRITGAGETQVLLLTGTPLRNNEHEAAVLLSLLDAQAAAALSEENQYTLDDVKDYLGYFMIRRTKAEVLPELPEKTRQRIDISALDSDQMEMYREALDWAHESYLTALSRGKSEAEARQNMQGGIERARTALGVAKVLGGEVADLVIEVVENKGCCVVFCAHHQASDNLKAQLEKEKLRVAVVDGRTPQQDRAALVDDFQEGRLDVFIGGINAAGEAITLTRADTVIFVELDWVPAALLQAEDRIHRVGQRSNCQVIQMIARMPADDNLDEMMVDLIGSKLARIGAVLNEDPNNIISDSIQSQLHDRLLARAQKQGAAAYAPEAKGPPLDFGPQEAAQDQRPGCQPRPGQ